MSVLTIVIPILLISFLMIIHELGHFLVAKKAGIKVEEFGIGFPPRLIAWRRGETEYSINLIPFGAFVRMLGEEDPTEPRSLARAPKRWRALTLFAGSGANLLVAILLFAVAYMVGWPSVVASEVYINQVAAGSPAEAAGFKSEDVIISMAGTSTADFETLKSVTRANLGNEIPVVVKRGDEQLTLSVTPRQPVSADQGPLGVAGYDKPTKVEPVSHDPFTSLWMGAQRTWDVLWLTLSVPAMIINGELSADLARPVGPVGIVQVAGQATTASVDSGWWYPILNVAAVFAAGLGLGNLLPLPALDGGRLVFVAIEAIRGKRISPQREGVIHFAGMVLLLSVIAVVTIMDIAKPVAQIQWLP